MQAAAIAVFCVMAIGILMIFVGAASYHTSNASDPPPKKKREKKTKEPKEPKVELPRARIHR